MASFSQRPSVTRIKVSLLFHFLHSDQFDTRQFSMLVFSLRRILDGFFPFYTQGRFYYVIWNWGYICFLFVLFLFLCLLFFHCVVFWTDSFTCYSQGSFVQGQSSELRGNCFIQWRAAVTSLLLCSPPLLFSLLLHVRKPSIYLYPQLG